MTEIQRRCIDHEYTIYSTSALDEHCRKREGDHTAVAITCEPQRSFWLRLKDKRQSI